jgi:hypothetical protein
MGQKSGEFSTRFALPFGGAYGGGGCPQEYEVDMLGRHIILSTYRRFSNISNAFSSLIVLNYH